MGARIKMSADIFHFGRSRLPEIRGHVITSGRAGDVCFRGAILLLCRDYRAGR
jgi:hypothetical protein